MSNSERIRGEWIVEEKAEGMRVQKEGKRTGNEE